MVRIVPEEHFAYCSYSEGTDIGDSDRTIPEVYIATMNKFISDYCNDF